MTKRIKTVLIIGGGPAGCTLGILLARKGVKVGLFQLPHRPPLIVGESLLPAVIPILEMLEVEKEIKQFSTFKPGATISLGGEDQVSFDFSLAATGLAYAYNVPRDLFDKTLLDAARRAGVEVFDGRAAVEMDKKGRPRLSKETLAATNGLGDHVDLIVDSTGRARMFPKLFEVPCEEGERKDIAMFSHQENVALSDPGNIHLDRFQKGWGWRIPLPGRVSVGIVVSPRHLAGLGNSRDEQYDNFLRGDPMLQQLTQHAKRITPVASYSNYQWQAKRLYGDGWALVGDSAGFVDPVFSTGLYLAMYSSVCLARAIGEGTEEAFKQYERHHRQEISSWQAIVDTWYDGRLFTLFRVGQSYEKSLLGRCLNPYMTRHVTRVFTGEMRSGSYSHRLLSFMTRYGLYKQDTAGLVIN